MSKETELQKEERIKVFLLKARQNTYAADEGKVKPQIPGTKQLEYREGDFLYRDIYAGEERFQGHEIIYFRSKPVWGMLYEGGIVHTPDNVTTEVVYSFLRRALIDQNQTARLFGSSDYEVDDFLYRDVAAKDFPNLVGDEVIVSKKSFTIYYSLNYLGGWIK